MMMIELTKLVIKIKRDSVSGYFHAFTNVGIDARVFALLASRTAIRGESANCQKINAKTESAPHYQSNFLSCQ